MDFSKLVNGFVRIEIWISLICYNGFVKIDTWISLCCNMDLRQLLFQENIEVVKVKYFSAFRFKVLCPFELPAGA